MNKNIKNILFTLVILVLATACSKTVKSSNEDIQKTEPALSNEIFKVDMPSKFDGLYDTVIKNSAIDFYDLECKSEGYGGWLFGIYAYENPEDWAGGPLEKVGELKLLSGKVYDITIAYPTESQFGFDREMPEKYKNMYDARYEIVENVFAISGEKVLIGEGTKGENLYKDQINKHLTSIKEKWDIYKLENEEMSPMYATIAGDGEDAFEQVGFFYKDINLDGIDELLIGEITDGEWKGIIYDLYTMVDRKPKHVFSGWDRNRYFAIEGGLLLNEGSSGAGLSETSIYALISNSTELLYQLGYKYDENENNPWFISYDSNKDNKNWENTTEDKIDEMKNRLKHLPFEYIPFSSINM